MSDKVLTPKAAFTAINPGYNREIVTKAWVSVPEKQIKDCKFTSYNALWDTGASNSVVTPKVVKQLGLTPSGRVQTHHAGGTSDVNTYKITLMLPNNVIIPNINVSECAEQDGRFDVIIGMDVITLGDFTISGQGAKRMVSFSMPSAFSVDYVQIVNTIHKTTGYKPPVSNEPIPLT